MSSELESDVRYRVYGRRHLVIATEITAGQVESNGSLQLNGWFNVTWGLTACTPDQPRAQRSVTSMGELYTLPFLARDVIYSYCVYATTMSVSVSLSVCLSVTEVHWRVIAILGFKVQFTAHCGRGECGREGRDHRRWKSGGIISRYASHC